MHEGPDLKDGRNYLNLMVILIINLIQPFAWVDNLVAMSLSCINYFDILWDDKGILIISGNDA